MRAAIYCRISQDRTGEALGVARQREDAEKLCTDRGWAVAEVLVDNDLSAYSGRARPGYTRLLDAVRAGEVDAIVAWHPDRLHRSPRELEDFVELVEEHKVAIATVRSGDLDLATASGRMTARIVGSVARHESEQKSERIRRALEQNAKAGRRHGSARPFGFEADGVTIREPEAELIRDAAARVLAGETVTGVARTWNEAGVKTPQRAAAWHPTKVRNILLSPRVAGLRAHKGEVVGEAVWEPVIDRQTWERLRSLLTRQSRPGRPSAYLLSAIARCGLCSGPLWGSKSGQRVRYICHSGPGRDGCGRIAVTARQLDAFITQVTITTLTDDGGRGLAQARERRAGEDRRQAKAADDLAIAEARLEELAGDYADGAITRREWLVARERLERRLTAARKVLDRGGDGVLWSLPTDTAALVDLWEAKQEDVAWRRAVIAATVDHVDVHPSRTRGSKLDQGRVEVVWR
jgi:site-specific DNA recombinase